MHDEGTWSEKLWAALALAAAAVVAQAARAEDSRRPAEFSDEPEWAYVYDVQKAGSGCPADIGEAVTYGDSVLVIDYDRMTAKNGSGVSARESRKFCQFVIDLDYADGWTYTVEAVYAETSVRLPVGAIGRAIFSAYIQGSGDTARAEQSYRGPAASYDALDLYFDAAVTAPCHERRALNVKAEVQALGSRSQLAGSPRTPGGASRVGLDGPAYLLLHWQRCE